MSLNEEPNSTQDITMEPSPNVAMDGGDSSDQSLSDSWTVLDSSHFKEDADLSDAESVEVLREDFGGDCNTFEEKCGEDVVSNASTIIAATQDFNDAASTFSEMATKEIDVSSQPDDSGHGAADVQDAATCTTPNPQPRHPPRKQFHFRGYRLEVVGEPLTSWLLQIAICSLFLDLILLCYFGMSSLAGLVEIPTPSYLKSSKPYQRYEMDPLSLQFSHVLAEWKKRPLEDHSLDRHVLKTLLLFYGGSSELSANLHSLTEKVQKHNDLIKRLGREHDWKEIQHHRMVTAAHIAHSVACILGKQDNERAIPEEFFFNYSKDFINEFAPEPGFWLNDWHLPQYFRANDTYYRISTKLLLPPIQNLYMHLGSERWNEYFWELKMQEEKAKEDEVGDGVASEKDLENDLEGEETERSPLDLTTSSDSANDEESSGNVEEISKNIAEELETFINNVELDEQELWNLDLENSPKWLREMFDIEDHSEEVYAGSGYTRKSVMNDVELLKKGQLTELFKEITVEKQQDEQQFVKSKGARNLNDFFEIQDVQVGENFEKDSIYNEPQRDEAFDRWHMDALKAEKLSEKNQDLNPDKFGNEKPVDEKVKQEKVRIFIEEMVSGDLADLNLDDFNRKFDEAFGLHIPKKPKNKGSKRRYKNVKSDTEGVMGRNKLKKKPKEMSGDDNLASESKKRMKKKKKTNKKDLKSGVNALPSDLHYKKRFVEERVSDWNARMAEGREKMRALNEREDDQIWVFERARARRDMREETFSE